MGRAVDAAPPDRATVVGLAGYPLMGKTTVAEQLCLHWVGGTAVSLPTETAISPRAARLSDGVDGSSAAAHDLRRLDAVAGSLLAGEPVAVPVYSWERGGHVASTTLPGLDVGGLLVLDGSVGCEPPLAARCDVLVFFRPRSRRSWLRQATDRDVRDRAWDRAQARRENLRKQRTVNAQLRDHGGRVTDVVAADPVDWTARIAGCPTCAAQPRRLRMEPSRDSSRP